MTLSYVSLVLQKVTSRVQLHLGLNGGWGKRDVRRVLAGDKRAGSRVSPPFDILIIGFNLHLRWLSRRNITRTGLVWNSVMHHKQVTVSQMSLKWNVCGPETQRRHSARGQWKAAYREIKESSQWDVYPRSPIRNQPWQFSSRWFVSRISFTGSEKPPSDPCISSSPRRVILTGNIERWTTPSLHSLSTTH